MAPAGRHSKGLLDWHTLYLAAAARLAAPELPKVDVAGFVLTHAEPLSDAPAQLAAVRDAVGVHALAVAGGVPRHVITEVDESARLAHADACQARGMSLGVVADQDLPPRRSL